MAALQPFDRHPADPDTLRGTSTTLASDAESALTLDGTTQQAHAPVPANWKGTGHPEAAAAAQRISADAGQVRGGLSAAAVALGAWSGSVQEFNTAVDGIVAQLGRAGSGRTGDLMT
ncbi:hypothetical protein, partial [Fodinicola feengrottensis]